MKRTKAFLLMLFILTLSISFLRVPIKAVTGQWSSSGSIIYYNDGKIGIGTSNPSVKLQVEGDLRVNNGLFKTYRNHSTGAAFQTFQYGAGEVMRVGVYNGSEIAKFVVKNNGNTGINYDSPATKLDVLGNVAVDGQANVVSRFRAANATNTDAGVMIGVINGNLPFIGTDSGGGTSLGLSLRTNGIERMRITNDNKVLIDGTLKAKEIQVKTNIWADYVFDNNYKLRSIEELAKYIKENKHLPNIPSQKEIEEKGLSIGEMQRLQMEKIEEQALYIIKMNEKLKDLENENKELEERIEKLENLLIK